MKSRMWSMLVLAGLIAVSACENEPLSNSAEQSAVQAQAPADGNSTKQVIELNFDTDPFTCPGGEELILHVGGWIQVLPLSNEKQMGLEVFHVIHTWRNSAGDTFVDLEIGPGRYYVDKNTGHLILAESGKFSFAGVMGRIVTDLTTGEVIFVTGPRFPDHLELACEALT